jgi:hypothetical protein
VAPFPASSGPDNLKNLLSPSQHPYIEVGMVMIRKKGLTSHVWMSRLTVTIPTS